MEFTIKIKKFFKNNKEYKAIKLLNNNGSNKVSFQANANQNTYLEGNNLIGKAGILDAKIGFNTYILSGKFNNCLIGRYCSIGNDVKIISDTHPYNFVSTHPGFFYSRNHMFPSATNFFEEYLKTDSNYYCEIGNDVWIGERVLIKGGVVIGDGAVIGMGSVVTKNVPPFAIVAGCPAKIIKFRFSEEQIAQLLKIKWWLWDADTVKSRREDFNNIDNFIRKYSLK